MKRVSEAASAVSIACGFTFTFNFQIRKPLMRIGIIGTGIAGLTAAWYLKDAGHHVTAFEQQASFGMGAHGVEFDLALSDSPPRKLYSDVPPRMFNSAQWPNLWQLYEELGVEIEAVNPTKTFAGIGQDAVLKLAANYLPKLSTELVLNPASRKILKGIGRMMNSAPKYLRRHFASGSDQHGYPVDELTFEEYLDTHGYSEEFINQFLFPALSSTVCTCSYQSLDKYPAATLLAAMLRLIEPEGLFRTRHGTKDVVARLAKAFDEIHLATSISSVCQGESDCKIQVGKKAGFVFDHVIVATQANSALRLIDGISGKEKEALGGFQYEAVETIVHTDASLMPARPRDWSAFNVLSNSQLSAAMCTIHLNQFYPEWVCDQPVFQTIMPIIAPQPETIIARASMQRPVVSKASARGHRLLGELHAENDRRIWYCGSYASPGIPLLESGVCSAIEVTQRLLAPTFI